MKTIKLTDRAELLLAAVAAGKFVFYFSDVPVGWAHIERAGYAERVPGSLGAKLTDAGRAHLDANPTIAERYAAL